MTKCQGCKIDVQKSQQRSVCAGCLDIVKKSHDIVLVNNVLAYINEYRQNSSKRKMQVACMKHFDDQEVVDAKTYLYEELADCLGPMQNRHDSNLRSKAEQCVVDIYDAFKEVDTKDVVYTCAAPHIAKLPKFGPEELEYVSAIDRIIQLEARMDMCEQNLNEHKVEQICLSDKVKNIETKTVSYAATVQKNTTPGSSKTVTATPVVSTNNNNGDKDNTERLSTSVDTTQTVGGAGHSSAGPDTQTSQSDTDFTLVNRRNKFHQKQQKRRNVTVGTGQQHGGVQGAPAPSRDIVVERVMKTTSLNSLQTHIVRKGITVRSLELLSHEDAKYQKFKLEIPKYDLQKVYTCENWPIGVVVRPYFPPKKGKGGNVKAGRALDGNQDASQSVDTDVKVVA